MGGEGRGAKTSATLFDRFQKNIKSLSFSSNNITKQNKKTYSFFIVMVKIVKQKKTRK